MRRELTAPASPCSRLKVRTGTHPRPRALRTTSRPPSGRAQALSPPKPSPGQPALFILVLAFPPAVEPPASSEHTPYHYAPSRVTPSASETHAPHSPPAPMPFPLHQPSQKPCIGLPRPPLIGHTCTGFAEVEIRNRLCRDGNQPEINPTPHPSFTPSLDASRTRDLTPTSTGTNAQTPTRATPTNPLQGPTPANPTANPPAFHTSERLLPKPHATYNIINSKFSGFPN